MEEGQSYGVEQLLAFCKPNLYRENAFRITGAIIDASAREISRQAERTRMERARGIPSSSKHALRLTSPPEGEKILQAGQRLVSPEKRILDELFWFWPHALGDSENDEALRALDRGDADRASELWLQQESAFSTANVSMHNLAVLAHASALDLELEGYEKGLPAEKVQLRDKHWGDALKRWRSLLSHDEFWSRFSARIRDLDDPRLTTGMARRIRDTLSVGILKVSAHLALNAAERHNIGEVKRHLSILRMWEGKPSDTFCQPALAALQLVVQPLCERIRTSIKAAKEKAGVEPKNADKVFDELIGHVMPLLKIIDLLELKDTVMRRALYDEVCEAGLIVQVKYGNSTEDWLKSKKMLEQIAPLASTESLRTRLAENLTILAANIERFLCWFCQENPGDDSAAIEIKMHGDITRTPTYNGTHIEWRYRTIIVPRCKECKKAHAVSGEQSSAKMIGGVIFSIAGLAVGGVIADVSIGCFMALSWGVGGLVLFNILFKRNHLHELELKKRIKHYGAKDSHPDILEFKKRGWQYGERPLNT